MTALVATYVVYCKGNTPVNRLGSGDEETILKAIAFGAKGYVDAGASPADVRSLGLQICKLGNLGRGLRVTQELAKQGPCLMCEELPC